MPQLLPSASLSITPQLENKMRDNSGDATSEEDTEVERRRSQEKQFNLIIENIDPRVKNHTVLYNSVLARLQPLKLGRNKTWSESLLAKDFYAWARVAGDYDRPNLEFLLAVLSAHGVLSTATTRNNMFTRECEKRGLRLWAEEQLELLENPKPADEPSNNRKNAVKPERFETENQASVTSGVAETVLPSIEESSETMESPIEVPHAKRQKISDQAHVPMPAKAMMRDATTQTNMSLLPTVPRQTPEAATSTLTQSITSAFKEAITQQTEALSKAFHSNMQMMLQGDIVEDAQTRNVQHLRPLPQARHAPVELAPPQPTLLLFDQQASSTNMHSNAAYEIERPMGRRVMARQVVEEPPQAFSVEAFRYVPRTFKREYGF